MHMHGDGIGQQLTDLGVLQLGINATASCNCRDRFQLSTSPYPVTVGGHGMYASK
jgi:hypothetical protein